MTLFVIDATLKATLILGAAAVVTLLLRRASAASRHLVWSVALLAAVALPALTVSLPKWQLGIVTVPAATAASAATAAPPPAAAPDDASSRMAERLRPPAATGRESSPPRSKGRAAAAWRLSDVSWPRLAMVLWITGAAIVLLRLVLGLAAVQFLSRRTQRADDAPWFGLARQLAGELGTSRVEFRRSPRATMPMAWGVLRPTVVMPAGADAWPDDRLRVVLLHELAHVKRRDCLTHMLAQVACALYWFNPLAWMAARRVRAERERACDDLVLAAGTPGPDYADQLLQIARVMRGGRFSSLVAGASLAMAQRSQLEGRLMAILDPSVPRSAVSRVRALAAAAVAAAVLVPLASVQAWTYASPSGPAVADAAAGRPVTSAHVVEAPATQVPPARSSNQSPDPRPNANPDPDPNSAIAAGWRGDVTAAVAASVADAVQDAVQAAVPVVVDEVRENQKTGAKADPKVIAALTAALDDSDKGVREAALHALVQLRDPSVFEPLLRALTDASTDMREQAAHGLAQLRDKRAVEPLIGALKDKDAGVREHVVHALGQLRDPRAVEPLISALKDTHANVREQAAFALGQLRATGAVEALVVALKDAEADVREQAAFALGQIRDPRAIDALATALKDVSADVREKAAFALGQLAR